MDMTIFLFTPLNRSVAMGVDILDFNFLYFCFDSVTDWWL